MKTLQKNNKTFEFLRNCNFSNSEADIFMLGLQIGPICYAKDLLNRSSLKPSTVYSALKRLEAKRVVTQEKEGREVVCKFTELENLKHILRYRIVQVESQIEELGNIVGRPTATNVTMGVSEPEIRAMLSLALGCKSRTWDIVAPRRNFLEKLDKDFIDYFKKLRIERDIESRTLWEAPINNNISVNLTDLVKRKPRLLPNRYSGKLHAMLIIYDNSTLFIEESGAGYQAVLVESSTVKNLQLALFESLWLESEKI